VKEFCVWRRISLTIAFAILSAGVLFSRDSGYKGKWVLDRGGSTATFDIPDNLTQEFKPKGSDLTIVTTWKEPETGIAPLGLLGIMTTEFKCGMSGQESTNIIGPFKQVSKTTQNGNQLVTEWTAADQNGNTITGHWTRTLSDDGNQMTLELQEQESGKTNNGRLIFRRK